MKDIIKSPGFIRGAVLTVVQTVYLFLAVWVYLAADYILYGITGVEATGYNWVFVISGCVALVVPAILSMLIADGVKCWLISLPVPVIVILIRSFENRGDFIRDKTLLLVNILALLVYLAGQAVGVGIKLLWLKRKARKRDQQ